MDIETDLDNPFWQYSLATYACPGVAELCLQLQDEYGADVNLWLWASWLQTQGLALSEDLLMRAEQVCQPWRGEVVQALRQLRRHLKSVAYAVPGQQVLRNQVKAAELFAEQAQQAALYQLSRYASPAVAARAHANLSHYLQTLPLVDVEHWLQRWDALLED